ncbi:hypothetical protein AGMMS50268_24320 [Spirochaetia bacterium]|nr:hypothetical protein AGMMS50268_24280 [Spirochaetia bacterium]GHV91929.1 hypothetical protein AGMMS50268_24320 [Spirochaetia bacterium]
MKHINKMTEEMIANEREFMENLLCQRFNFFITFFAIIIAGACASLEMELKIATMNLIICSIILEIGLLILRPISKTIERAQVKLDIILKYYCSKNHPNNAVNALIDYVKDNKNIKDNKNMKFYKKYIKDWNDVPKIEKKEREKIEESESEKDIVGYILPNMCIVILDLLWILIIIFIFFSFKKYYENIPCRINGDNISIFLLKIIEIIFIIINIISIINNNLKKFKTRITRLLKSIKDRAISNSGSTKSRI